VLLAALLCGNVAMLLFARAVSRERELLVRAALGASRARIIMQLFAEALLLSAAGAAGGLIAARFVLSATWATIEGKAGSLPFWLDTSLSATTILYAVGLTLFAAAIAGFVPALKVTSGAADRRLRAASSGGGGLRFGGVWTVVIVAQIALTTVLPVPLLGVGGDVTRKTPPPGFAAEAFLTATLAVDRFDGVAASGDTVPAARAARLEARYRALADRLRQEPGVLDVTYADQMPLTRLRWSAIEAEGSPPNDGNDHCKPNYCAGSVSVDPRFFDVVGAPVIRGRALTTADAEQKTRAVVVNEFFVKRVLHGRNPIGGRIRFASNPDRGADSWYQIVGVVPDLGVSDNEGDWGRAGVYRARLPRETGTLRVAIHVRGDPQRFATRLRELAQGIDPALRVIDPKPLTRLADSQDAFWLGVLGSLAIVTLMLSLAGVYAVTAFAVAKRTREIGVRVALGAQPMHVLTTVFKRPLVQLALGIGVGAILALAIVSQADVSDLRLKDFGNTAIYALLTVLCCGLACIVPTRRALRIQPTEALKDEG
jgi:predicted permease